MGGSDAKAMRWNGISLAWDRGIRGRGGRMICCGARAPRPRVRGPTEHAGEGARAPPRLAAKACNGTMNLALKVGRAVLCAPRGHTTQAARRGLRALPFGSWRAIFELGGA